MVSMEEEMQANATIPYYKKLPSPGLGKKGVEDMVSDKDDVLVLCLNAEALNLFSLDRTKQNKYVKRNLIRIVEWKTNELLF